MQQEGLPSRLIARFGSLKLIRAVSLFAAAGFIAFCVSMIVHEREGARRQAVKAAQDVAEALADTIHRNFDSYDIFLDRLAASLRDRRLAALPPDLKKLVVFGDVANSLYVNDAIVADAEGKVIEAENASIPIGSSIAGQDYFMAQKSSSDAGFFVGKPRFSDQAGGDWVISLSRRIEDRDGAFAGVTAMTVSLSYFESLFANIKTGPGGIISVERTDGIMLMRNPFRRENIGGYFGNRQLWRRLAAHSKVVREGTARTDGVSRIYSILRVGNLPLAVTVALNKNVLFAPWRDKIQIIFTMMVVLSAAMVALGWLLEHELRRRRATEEELSRAVSKLAIAASTDELTGLGNRRSFAARADREWTQAAAASKPLSLVVIDVDHFKQFNDRFGHQRGDDALKAVASCIRAVLTNPADYAARYGGEEFMLLLPGSKTIQAEKLADSIRRAIAETEIAECDGLRSRLTVSAGGVTVLPNAGISFAAAFEAADRALYEAKTGGRNCTKFAEVSDAPGRPRDGDPDRAATSGERTNWAGLSSAA